jgi:hypothetical protein
VDYLQRDGISLDPNAGLEISLLPTYSPSGWSFSKSGQSAMHEMKYELVHKMRMLAKKGSILMGSPLWWMSLNGKNPEQIGGFYTTRIVMAESQDAAIALAIEVVRHELRPIQRNPPDSPVRMEIEECEKLEGIVTWQGAGFSFWC